MIAHLNRIHNFAYPEETGVSKMCDKSMLRDGRIRRLVTAVCICLAILAANGAAAAAQDRPNILLVIADDMGIDASPCYPIGDEKPNMPVLEAMCASGVVFDNVWSNPECSPTRATILTGRYGFRTGVTSAVLPMRGTGVKLGEVSIQRLLDRKLNVAYAHAVIGKWHLSDETNGDRDNPQLMGVGHYSGFLKYYGHDDYWKWPKTTNGETKTFEGYATSALTDEAIDWIGRQEKPWFLWLAYTAPHSPFHLPPSGLHTRSDLSGGRSDVARNPLPYYLAMIETIDREMGRLLSTLSAEARRNTIVIFLGDNGTPREVIQPPYKRFQGKHTVFQGGIHVPMIVSGTGIDRTGEREPALINTTDLFATIADLAGTGITRAGDSISFRHLLRGQPGPMRRHLYAEYNDHSGSWRDFWTVRDDRHKLVHFATGNRLLYDLKTDPFERHNLLEDDVSDEESAIVDSLAAIVADLRKQP